MNNNLNPVVEVSYLNAEEVHNQCAIFTISKEFAEKIKPALLAQTNRAYCGMFFNKSDIPNIDSIEVVKDMGMDGLVLNARYTNGNGDKLDPIWYGLNVVNPQGAYVPMLIGLYDTHTQYTSAESIPNEPKSVLCFVFTKDTAVEMIKGSQGIMDSIEKILDSRGMYHDNDWAYKDKNFEAQYSLLFKAAESEYCTDLSQINKDQNTRILQQLLVPLRLGSMYYENSHGVVSVSVAVKHVFKEHRIVATKFITAYAPFNEQVIRVQWPEEMTDLMKFIDMHKVSSGAIKPLEKLFNGSLIKALN